MDRPYDFTVEADADDAGGLAGAARSKPRRMWASDAPAADFELKAATVHAIFAPRVAAIVARQLGSAIEGATFDRSQMRDDAIAADAMFSLNGTHVASLTIDGRLGAALTDARFGGSGSPDEAGPCAGIGLIARHALDEIAALFTDIWDGAGLQFEAADTASQVQPRFCYALRIGGGELRVAYAADLDRQPGASEGGTLFGVTALVARTPVDLSAVLAEPVVTIGAFTELGLGSIIPLDPGSGVSLRVGSQRLAEGFLVASGSQRAVQLSAVEGGRK